MSEGDYPTVVLTDAQRRPYGRIGFMEGVPAFLARAGQMLEVRRQRDALLQEVARAKGAAKLVPAKKAVELLQKDGLIRFYDDLLDEWFALA